MKVILRLPTGWTASLLLAALLSGFGTRSARSADLPKLQINDQPLARDIKLSSSFAPVVKQAAPSVVNIYSSKTVKTSERFHQFFDDPFWRRFFGDNLDADRRPRERTEESLGSGVIVSADGYILSNSHVVEGADEIKVALANGRKAEYVAKLIGSDPRTEIAVLKIEAENLPAITLTDSDHLEVGDLVVAIGNPFGLGQTVTMGIVSATSRGGFGLVDYEDFIQTDASINPGNSGGALVDAEGRLVGINTFIISRSGGNQGIGFAIPINMARHVMSRLIESGKVARGYLGAFLEREITDDLAAAFHLPSRQGALVTQVIPDSPADKAGLKYGDAVLAFDGKPVTDSRSFRLMVSQTAPDTKVELKLIRDGQEKTVSVTLAELPENAGLAGWGGIPEPQAKPDVLDGVTVDDLDANTRRQFNVPANVQGALVAEVDPGSASAAAGLQVGDVILEINRQTVRNAEEAVNRSKEIQGDRVLLRVWSPRGTRFVVVAASTQKP